MTSKEENPVLYVVLNGELGMSPGKAAAQATHAAMLLEGNYDGIFVSGYKRTVVVLEAENGETLKNLLEYCQGAEIFAAYYVDEKSEEGKPYQITALAVEPIAHDDEEKRSVFKDFPLYGTSSKSVWQTISNYVNKEAGILGVPWYVRLTLRYFKRGGSQ